MSQVRDVYNDHPLWMPFDFEGEGASVTHDSVLYHHVVECGLGICKICGAAEIELDVQCTGQRPERTDG